MINTTNTSDRTRTIAGVLRGRAGLIAMLVLAAIGAGQSVTFDFGAVAHNVIFDDRTAATPADIVGNNVNTSTTRTFTTAGTYNYHCNIHPGMSGVVVVRVTQGM